MLILFEGMTVLDLGCGWGSVTLFVAKKFPKIQVFSLSNSATQREFIESEAKLRGLKNVKVFTGDVAVFESEEFRNRFDRIISIGESAAAFSGTFLFEIIIPETTYINFILVVSSGSQFNSIWILRPTKLYLPIQRNRVIDLEPVMKSVS